jgi:hypothetical protein
VVREKLAARLRYLTSKRLNPVSSYKIAIADSSVAAGLVGGWFSVQGKSYCRALAKYRFMLVAEEITFRLIGSRSTGMLDEKTPNIRSNWVVMPPPPTIKVMEFLLNE